MIEIGRYPGGRLSPRENVSGSGIPRAAFSAVAACCNRDGGFGVAAHSSPIVATTAARSATISVLVSAVLAGCAYQHQTFHHGSMNPIASVPLQEPAFTISENESVPRRSARYTKETDRKSLVSTERYEAVLGGPPPTTLVSKPRLKGAVGLWHLTWDGGDCYVQLTRQKLVDGFKAFPMACKDTPIAGTSAWRQRGNAIQLFDEDGAVVAEAKSAGPDSYTGMVADGGEALTFDRN